MLTFQQMFEKLIAGFVRACVRGRGAGVGLEACGKGDAEGLRGIADESGWVLGASGYLSRNARLWQDIWLGFSSKLLKGIKGFCEDICNWSLHRRGRTFNRSKLIGSRNVPRLSSRCQEGPLACCSKVVDSIVAKSLYSAALSSPRVCYSSFMIIAITSKCH